MAIDLLQLDKDCAMPTILRRKWRDLHGYDPVQTRRVGGRLVFLTLLVVAVSLIFLLFGKFELAKAISGFLWLGLAIFLAIRVAKGFDKSERFARALENLPLLLSHRYSNSVEILCNLDERSMRERAEKEMVLKVHALLVAERRAKENTDRLLQEGLDKNVAFHRQELKAAHAELLAFQLVDEKWDRYFEYVQAELPKEESENLPNDSAALNEIATADAATSG